MQEVFYNLWRRRGLPDEDPGGKDGKIKGRYVGKESEDLDKK